MAISMKAKEVLVQKSAFPKPLANLKEFFIISLGIAYMKVTQKEVSLVLMVQSIRKAPGLNKINFGILQTIWN